MGIAYITKERFQEVLNSEVSRVKREGKKFILTPEGFANHLINVGDNAGKIASAILARHPTLSGILSEGVVRSAGFMHDFGKYDVGDPYHEIDGAYTILKRGHELELVAGGSKSERDAALARIAACLPSDGIVFEQLGENPGETSLYPLFFTDEMAEKLEFIRRALAKNGERLEVDVLTSPMTIEQKLIIYADYKNLGGKIVSLKERLDEVGQRYNSWAKSALEGNEELEKFTRICLLITRRDISDFYLSVPKLLQQTSPRTLAVMGTIDELLGDSSK